MTFFSSPNEIKSLISTYLCLEVDNLIRVLWLTVGDRRLFKLASGKKDYLLTDGEKNDYDWYGWSYR